MTTNEFAVITRRVIARDGFAEFQPTACYPERKHVKTLAGLPTDIDPEEPVLQWAARGASDGEEFLVAFKVAEDSFRVIRRSDTRSHREDYSSELAGPCQNQGEPVAAPIRAPDC